MYNNISYYLVKMIYWVRMSLSNEGWDLKAETEDKTDMSSNFTLYHTSWKFQQKGFGSLSVCKMQTALPST